MPTVQRRTSSTFDGKFPHDDQHLALGYYELKQRPPSEPREQLSTSMSKEEEAMPRKRTKRPNMEQPAARFARERTSANRSYFSSCHSSEDEDN
jgi:hypothetical protein